MLRDLSNIRIGLDVKEAGKGKHLGNSTNAGSVALHGTGCGSEKGEEISD